MTARKKDWLPREPINMPPDKPRHAPAWFVGLLIFSVLVAAGVAVVLAFGWSPQEVVQ